MTHAVFVSYRREDSAGFARAVYDRLVDEFDSDRVFMDVDAIEPGVDFIDAIDSALARCDALIAVIGKQWLSIRGEHGRRLDAPDDYVRLEIATALKRGIRVIPLLVNDADMPRAEDLPDELEALARRNALSLSATRFAADVDYLIETLGGLVERAPNDDGSDMARIDYVRFLEKALGSQRMAQRFHLGLAVAVALGGLVAVGGAHGLAGVLIPADQKWLVTLGGSFMSSLSTLPIKQIADRRTHISALEFLLDGFRRLDGNDMAPVGPEARPLTERFWKLMDASLGTARS